MLPVEHYRKLQTVLTKTDISQLGATLRGYN